MITIDSLIAQFDREAGTTRRHFERLPNDKLGWRPHPKSFTASELASHIVECVTWGESIFTVNEVNFDPSTYKRYEARSTEDLLVDFDKHVATVKQIMGSVSNDALKEAWSLKAMGRTLFERPRGEVFLDFVLHHIIHHRGQFSVYLRLLEVPVPGSYGPTADEQG